MPDRRRTLKAEKRHRGRGRRCDAPSPLGPETERAYKPNSVAPTRLPGESGRSSIWDADCSTPPAAYPGLGRATRDGAALRRPACPMLGLAPGGVCLAGPVTRTAGGLLRHPFTLAPASPSQGMPGRPALCCTCRRVASPGRYPAPCSTEFGLSSRRRCRPATVRPTQPIYGTIRRGPCQNGAASHSLVLASIPTSCVSLSW